MRVALDINGKRIHIDQSHVKEKYFCPECGEELIIKKGKIKVHHFAHKANSQCNDGWHYDMSEWHSSWQDKFPIETQEVVKKHNGKTHRADVLIESIKTVIEFQHSPLSPDEFHERTIFYRNLGYKVIWLFDVFTQYEDETLREHDSKNDIFIWSRPRNTFNYLSSISKEYDIYLELLPSAEMNSRILSDKQDMANMPDIDDLLGPDEQNYFDEHKDDEGYIAKVSWIPPSGFERFAVSDYYTTEGFVSLFSKAEKNGTTDRKINKEKVYDKPRYLYSKDHSSYYDGCPISSSGKCVDSTIDIPESLYKEITPCELCKYSKYLGNHYVCFKKIMDLKLPKEAEIIEFERYDEYSLKSITVKINGERKKYDFKPLVLSKSGKSIFELWNETKPDVAIFRNIRTGYFVKINRDPSTQFSKYHKVYGRFSKDQYSFTGDSRELYDVSKKEWVIIWKTSD